MKLDEPEFVRREYASEERLLVRQRTFRELLEGPSAVEVAFRAVEEVSPRRVLEVGCGPGELAERMTRELEAEVVALDLSPRMVELARTKGVNARVGDVQELPFPDGSFDCALAGWMLYHASDLDRGLAELARVLQPDGRLVAATYAVDNQHEVWALLGDTTDPRHSFSDENGEEALSRHFGRVERRDVRATTVFPDRASLVEYVRASIRRRNLADRVPHFEGPFRSRNRQIVFVAEKRA